MRRRNFVIGRLSAAVPLRLSIGSVSALALVASLLAVPPAPAAADPAGGGRATSQRDPINTHGAEVHGVARKLATPAAVTLPAPVWPAAGTKLTVATSGMAKQTAGSVSAAPAVLQRGQLAVAPAGLVGVVTAVDARRGEATIDLVTSVAFSQHAHTDISNVSGSVRGVGGRLLMEQIPTGPDAEINQGNRVLVADPAHESNSAGAVTIGRATTSKPAAASAVELTPTVDFAQLKEIWIMRPYSGSSR